MPSKTQDHASIPLIYLTSQNQPKFILNPKAIQHIQSLNNPSSQTTFISICGDYRSGKSFLMNSLFFSKQGFKVSPTTQPCTKGINLWSKPMSYNGKNIWILDTQGFGAIDRDDSYDVKIFLLTTLISDIVMYNSFGALDQNTINKFAAICHKAESLDKGIKKIKMFWILRDFSLSIQNKEGRILTADQYLQSALDDGLSTSNQRQAIKRVFGQRHCIPLVRPVIDETILSQLSQIKFQQLRGEFVEQVYKLRKKLLSCIESKVIEGVKVDGENLGMFLNKYVEVLNENEVETDISSTWEKIIEYEKEKQEGKLMAKIREILNKQLQKIPFNSQGLYKLTQQSDKQIDWQLTQLQKHFTDKQYIKQTQQSITRYINQSRDLLITKNMDFLKNEQKKCVKSIFDNVQKQVGKQSRVDDNQLIQKYLEKLFKTKDQYMYKYGKYLQKEKKLSFTNNDTVSSNFNSNSNNNSALQRQRNKQPQLQRVNQLLLQSTQLIYYQHFYQQQKLMFPKIVGQLSQQLASTISKMNQTKKAIKSKDIDIKQYKQQKEKLSQQLNTINKQLTKIQLQKQQVTKQLQLKHHQLQTISTRSQNEYTKIKQQYQQNIQQLKQTILSLQKQFLSIKKQNQLQQLQYKDKLQLLNEKNQLLLNKIQQSKVMNQKSIQQIKQQYQQKIKKQQQKYIQIQNSLNLQRKKFLQLNKNKKQQQSQLLQDLAEKNQRLLQLRREITNIEHIYKQQLDSILVQQRRTVQQQYYLQVQQKQHLIHVLQQKLQQCIIRIQQLQQVQKKYQTLLMQHRLLSQQHLNVIDKYKEIVNKLKRSTQTQQQKDNLFEEIKSKYQLQLKNKQQQINSKQQLINSKQQQIKSKQQQIKSKQQLLRKLKVQIKSTQEQATRQLQQLQARHLIEQSQIKQQQQQQYQQRLRSRLSQLQYTHRLQKQQILQQLKQGYNQIQGLKSVNKRLQGQYKSVKQVINRMRRQFKTNEKDIKQILRKYKKLQKQNQLSIKKKQLIEQQKNINDNNNKKINNITNSQFDRITQNMSMIEQSSMLQQQQQQQQSVSYNNQQQYQQTTTLLVLSLQQLHQLQCEFIHLLHSNKSLTEQLQDLKHSFKQTISQLQQCQSHINKLNKQINKQQQQLNILNSMIAQLQQTKKQLHQKTIKLQSLQKSTQLLKKQVQLRDQIYIKRQSSIKQNLQLYKQTIANLTQQNQHLIQKCTKLQIQLNRFTQWQADLTIYNNSNNNNKSKSNIGSYQFMTENMQEQDQMYSFGDKINKLQKENRKLKKQLNQQKQLTFNNSLKQPSSTTNLTNILTDNNFSSQIQSLKKQNQLYKKRVQQLRQRQLKLLQQLKAIKLSQKQSAENKVNLVKEQFESYRKKAKQEIVQLQKRVDQLTEQKYKLKQQMLVIRQDRNSYHMYSGGKTVVNGNNNNNAQNVNNNASNYSNNDNGNKTMNGYMSRINYTSTNNNNNNNNNTNQQQSQRQQPLSQSTPYNNNQLIQSYTKTIQNLKQQNTHLKMQLTTLNTQLIKLKDQSDKKLASLQIFYQEQIRTLQNQKSRLDLQNQKNKTKYQHLLKVNNQLIIEVDNFKAKANNSLTLKEKYKHKISALFNDD